MTWQTCIMYIILECLCNPTFVQLMQWLAILLLDFIDHTATCSTTSSWHDTFSSQPSSSFWPYWVSVYQSSTSLFFLPFTFSSFFIL